MPLHYMLERKEFYGKVRRQHYVPRMYLKRFGYGNIGDEYISVLKLDNGTVLDNRKVENFAVANYFYDADKEQIAEILKEDLKVFPELCDNENLSDDQFTEHVLAREESAISKMLNELQEDLSTIHISSNRNLMIIFLHSLAYRTKQFRDQMDAINNKTEKWLSSMCDNLGLDEETKKKTIEINCSTGKNTQLYQILGIKPVLETMQMLQYNYEWYEAVNNTELDFVISDNPAQTVRNGFNDICIPVSSNKAIIFRIKDKTAPLISKDMPENGIINLSLNSVIAYNCMQLAMGQKFLFGTSNTIKYMKKCGKQDRQEEIRENRIKINSRSIDCKS